MKKLREARSSFSREPSRVPMAKGLAFRKKAMSDAANQYPDERLFFLFLVSCFNRFASTGAPQENRPPSEKGWRPALTAGF
jgi:hypothetical protein